MNAKNKKSIEQIALDEYVSTVMEKRRSQIATYLGIISFCLSVSLSVVLYFTTTNNVAEVFSLFSFFVVLNGILIFMGLAVISLIPFVIMQSNMERKIITSLSDEEKTEIIARHINSLITDLECTVATTNREMKTLEVAIRSSETTIVELKEKLKTM